MQDVWYQLSRIVDLEEMDSISGWLYRVARNRIIDRYRKQDDELLTDFSYEDEEGDLNFKEILLGSEESPNDVFFKEIFWDALIAALEELPETQRQVFIWNEMEDMTPAFFRGESHFFKGVGALIPEYGT